MVDGFEPHGTIVLRSRARGVVYTGHGRVRWGRGVPGVGVYGWVLGGAIPVPSPTHAPGPIFNLFLRQALPMAK